MATVKFKDADNNDVYFYVDSGAGTLGDPYILGSAVLDYDTDGGGTDNIKVVGLGLPGSGGVVAGGTSTDPIRTDPTGTTAQPVTVIDGGDVTQGDVDDAAVVTDTTGTLSGKMRGLVKWAYERMPASLGQKTKANSLSVTLASDSGIGVDQNIGDAYTGTETGPIIVVVRDDALSTLSDADNDKVAARVDFEGALWTRHKAYKTVTTGERQGSATVVQLPTVACSMVNIKAVNSNAGNVYIGVSGATKPDGTTDTTTGFELDAGEETGWLPVANLNTLYMICDNAGDDITYITVD